MKTHLRDIRLFTNAGVRMPLCYANQELLDFDKGRLPTTGTLSEVTCNHCRKQAPKRYPWAYGPRA